MRKNIYNKRLAYLEDLKQKFETKFLCKKPQHTEAWITKYDNTSNTSMVLHLKIGIVPKHKRTYWKIASGEVCCLKDGTLTYNITTDDYMSREVKSEAAMMNYIRQKIKQIVKEYNEKEGN